MSDDKGEPAAKYFKNPKLKILAVLLQYVIGPALTATITTFGLYFVQIKDQVQADVEDGVKEGVSEELDAREAADATVLDFVRARVAEITTASTTAAVGTSAIMAQLPELFVRGERVIPRLIEQLQEQVQSQEQVDVGVCGEGDDAPETALTQEQEQDQVQEMLPGRIVEAWKKRLGRRPGLRDYERIREAANRVQAQVQMQQEGF